MLSDQRAFRRFNIFAVGKFKALGRPAEAFIGITRDFSCGGLSFESQHFDLTPGDKIEFKFKHPKLDIFVSALGEIIWKKNASKFDCLTGIKFREMVNFTESKLSWIMSAIGGIPVDSFLNQLDSGGETDDLEEEITVAAGPQAVAALSDQKNHVEAGEVTGQLLDEEEYMTAETDLEGAVEAAEDENNKGTKKWLYAGLLLAVGAVSGLIIIGGHQNDQKTERITSEINVPFQDVENEPLSVAGDGTINNSDRKEVRGGTGQPQVVQEGGKNNDKESKAIISGRSPARRSERGSKEYYIQVGAWKNPAYAGITLKKIRNYYPEAYIEKENNFHKIKIPHIMNKKEGARVSKEIKDKYNLTAILVLKHQEK